jgi:hypothetical protein
LHWIEIPGRLAIMAGVDLVISLLEREEVSDLGLQREAELCRASGIEFVSFPIPDRGVPDVQPTLESCPFKSG